MENNKFLINLKRKANQITTDEDIVDTDDTYLNLCRKIFVNYYGEKYQQNDLSLYQMKSINYTNDSNKMINPHFIRDDGTIIYLQLLQNNIYLKQIHEEILNLSMKVMKLNKVSLFTITLKPTFKISNINNSSQINISSCYQKIKEDKFTMSSLNKNCVLVENNKRRKLINKTNVKNKNIEVSGFVKDQWISASKTRNYALKDTLVDWLDSWYNKTNTRNVFRNVRKEEDEDESCFSGFLKNKGKQFEDNLVIILQKKFKEKMVTICENMDNYKNRVLEYEEMTKNEIMRGTPLIYQGIVMNRSGPLVYSYGIPDLLIRSDYLDQLVELCPLDDNMKIFKASKLNGNYHYVVVDIKWTTLELCADGLRLRNSGSMSAYKNQLYIYNHALGKIQGYEPKVSFILGRRYKYECKGIVYSENNSFARFGHIRYDGWDEYYINESIDAINWIKNLRLNGKKWSLLPKPSVPELYPNISSTSESAWDQLKKDYGKKIGEITMLWNCGPKNREIAHQNGVYSYFDDKCTAQSVGIFGPKKGPTLDKIIQINKKRKFDNPMDRLTININNKIDNQWMNPYKLRITVDFETINNLFDDFKDLPYRIDNNFLFMIGVSYKVYGQDPKYKMFLISELSKNAEFQIIYQFYQFLRDLTDEHIGKDAPIPPLYHWGHIERTFFSGLCDRLEEDIGIDIYKDIDLMYTKLDWYDMCECFKNNPIVINGCFTFGLKEIANKLVEYDLIRSNWSDNNSSCSNGNIAMIMAYKSYVSCKKNGVPINQDSTMKEIRDYNKIDCIVIHEIVDLLREKIILDNQKSQKKRRFN